MNEGPNEVLKEGSLQHLIETLERLIWDVVTPDDDVNNDSPMTGDRIKLKLSEKDEIDKIIAPIRLALEQLNAEEVLSPNRISDKDGATLGDGKFIDPIHDEIQPRIPGIRYLCVCETDLYTLGIFVFPPNETIPLHDHPDMTVLSRVLYGDLQVKAFDNISMKKMGEPDSETLGSSSSWMKRIVSFAMSTIFALLGKQQKEKRHAMIRAFENQMINAVAPEVTVLYPSVGNIHEFTAGERGAAVLDVLLPPYRSDHDRDCTHYEKIGTSSGPGEPCWLCPIPKPEWFSCRPGNYKHF